MRKKTKLREKVVYWHPTGVDRDGQRTFAAPVELDARWEDGQVDVQTGPNTIWRSSTQIYFLAKYDQDGNQVPNILQGGYIWRGLYSRLVATAPPTDNPDVVEVERVSKIGTRRNRQVFVTAYG